MDKRITICECCGKEKECAAWENPVPGGESWVIESTEGLCKKCRDGTTEEEIEERGVCCMCGGPADESVSSGEPGIADLDYCSICLPKDETN